MAEYIDRKAAIDVVTKWFKKINLNGDICIDGLNSLPAVDVAKGVIEYWKKEGFIPSCDIVRTPHYAIHGVPAADVVEVVRCKDCFNRTKSGMCIQWSRYEKIVNTSDYAFCSWGVKRDV